MDYLYKYMSLNNNFYKNIINGTLWFSNLDQFNDPFEFEKPVIYDASQKGIELFYDNAFRFGQKSLYFNLNRIDFISEWQNNKDAFEKRIKRQIELLSNTLGILCLSLNCSNIQMWSHYSDSHKGVCLEFEPSKGVIFEGCDYYTVNYPPENHYQVLFDEDIKTPNSILGLLLTKSSIWKNEQEMRVFKDKPGLYCFNKATLTSLIFVYNSNPLEKETIIKLVKNCNYPNVKFKEVNLDEDDYKLIIKNCG